MIIGVLESLHNGYPLEEELITILGSPGGGVEDDDRLTQLSDIKEETGPYIEAAFNLYRNYSYNEAPSSFVSM